MTREQSESESSTIQREERDFLTNPYWIEDPDLRKGEVDYLSNSEILFWKDLIDKYLFPIDQDKAEQVTIAINCNHSNLLDFPRKRLVGHFEPICPLYCAFSAAVISPSPATGSNCGRLEGIA